MGKRASQFIDAHERVWTSKLGRRIVHDPNRNKPDHDAKPLKLIRVSVDDQPVVHDSVTVPPDHHDLRVDFALLSWLLEDESRFRIGLEGFSKARCVWTKDAFRDIGALPPGKYVLDLEARLRRQREQIHPAAHHRRALLVAASMATATRPDFHPLPLAL